MVQLCFLQLFQPGKLSVNTKQRQSFKSPLLNSYSEKFSKTHMKIFAMEILLSCVAHLACNFTTNVSITVVFLLVFQDHSEKFFQRKALGGGFWQSEVCGFRSILWEKCITNINVKNKPFGNFAKWSSGDSLVKLEVKNSGRFINKMPYVSGAYSMILGISLF